MATQRYISTSFWDDKWIRSLNPSDRYLYMYLLTNTLTNICGIYQITIDRIAYDTGYDERTLRPMLNKFKEAGKAALIDDEWIILPSWPKHQRWEIKNTIKAGIDAALEAIPKSILYQAKLLRYTYPIDSLLVGYQYSPSYSDIDSDSDSDSDIDLGMPVARATPERREELRGIEPPPSKPLPVPRAKKPPKERDPLRDALADSFRAKTPEYASPAKENASLLRLAAAIRRKAQADALDADEAAQGCLETFWRLHESGKQFYSDFTPSKMLSALEGLWFEYLRSRGANDTSWVGAAV